MKQKYQKWLLMPGSGWEVLELGLEKEIFRTHWVEPEVPIRVPSLSWTERRRMMRVRSFTLRKRHGQPAPPETQEHRRQR